MWKPTQVCEEHGNCTKKGTGASVCWHLWTHNLFAVTFLWMIMEDSCECTLSRVATDTKWWRSQPSCTTKQPQACGSFAQSGHWSVDGILRTDYCRWCTNKFKFQKLAENCSPLSETISVSTPQILKTWRIIMCLMVSLAEGNLGSGTKWVGLDSAWSRGKSGTSCQNRES